MKILELYYKKKKGEVPRYAKYPLSLIIIKPIRKWINVVVIPNVPFSKLRVLLYRVLGFNIGKNVFIGMKCYMDDLEPNLTTIEDGCTISYCCKFSTHGENQDHTPINIQKGSYIGMNTTILSGKKGIIIGEKAVIGAGSVVVNNIPKGSVAVGVPARVIGKSKR